MSDQDQDTLAPEEPRSGLPQGAPGTPGTMPLPQAEPLRQEPATSVRADLASDDETSAADAKPTPPAGPARMAWRRFRRHRPGMIGLGVLIVLYLMVIFADF